MIRVSVLVTLFAAAMWVAAGVTVLPRAKPGPDETPPPVEYAPVMLPEIQQDSQAVKLESLERRLRLIQSKVDRIEGKVEGQ